MNNIDILDVFMTKRLTRKSNMSDALMNNDSKQTKRRIYKSYQSLIFFGRGPHFLVMTLIRYCFAKERKNQQI